MVCPCWLSKALDFLKRALSEEDSLPSTSRINAFLITVMTMFWVTYVVLHTGVLPDLTSASMFIAAGHGGYVANRVSDAISSKGDA